MSDYRIEAATKEEWAERALKAEKALAGALANLADASRARGEAEGKLAASEMAGIVEGWKARAEKAEAAAHDQEIKHMAATVGIDSLTERLEKSEKARRAAEAEADLLRAAFRVNAIRWNPDISHAEINAEIERILNAREEGET